MVNMSPFWLLHFWRLEKSRDLPIYMKLPAWLEPSVFSKWQKFPIPVLLSSGDNNILRRERSCLKTAMDTHIYEAAKNSDPQIFSSTHQHFKHDVFPTHNESFMLLLFLVRVMRVFWKKECNSILRAQIWHSYTLMLKTKNKISNNLDETFRIIRAKGLLWILKVSNSCLR